MGVCACVCKRALDKAHGTQGAIEQGGADERWLFSSLFLSCSISPFVGISVGGTFGPTDEIQINLLSQAFSVWF